MNRKTYTKNSPKNFRKYPSLMKLSISYSKENKLKLVEE
jgi:hypothetical protein